MGPGFRILRIPQTRASFARWLIPTATTLTFLALVGHTSDVPQFLSRYSMKYFIFMVAVGILSVASWWVVLDVHRYRRFVTRVRQIPIFSFIVAAVGLLALVDILVPLAKFPFLTVIVPITVLVSVGVLPLANIRETMNKLTLLTVAAGIGLFMAEGVFRLVLLERRIAATETEFARLIGSSWPRPIPVAKKPGTFRILGLADSFGRRGGPDNYYYVLERFLNSEGLNVEVINISLDGYEPPDQLEMLKRFGARYKPDLVVHSFFVGNDFSAPEGPLSAYRNIPLRPATGLGLFRPRDFTLVEWLRRYARASEHRRGMKAEGSRGETPGTFATDEFLRIERNRMRVCKLAGDPNIRWQKTIRILEAIWAEVGRIGADYIMVIHPDQYQVENELRHAVVRKYALDLRRYDFDLPQRFLGKYCTDQRVQCLDLLPAFRAQGSRGGLYLLRDTHYNRKGNKLAADLIYEFMQNRHLLSVGRSPKT